MLRIKSHINKYIIEQTQYINTIIALIEQLKSNLNNIIMHDDNIYQLRVFKKFLSQIELASKYIATIQNNISIYYSSYMKLINRLEKSVNQLYNSSQIQTFCYLYVNAIVKSIQKKPKNLTRIVNAFVSTAPPKFIYLLNNIYAQIYNLPNIDKENIKKLYLQYNQLMLQSENNNIALFNITKEHWNKIFKQYHTSSIHYKRLVLFIQTYIHCDNQRNYLLFGSQQWIWFYSHDLIIKNTMSKIFKKLLLDSNMEILTQLINNKYFCYFESDYQWCKEQIELHTLSTTKEEKKINLCKQLCKLHDDMINGLKDAKKPN